MFRPEEPEAKFSSCMTEPESNSPAVGGGPFQNATGNLVVAFAGLIILHKTKSYSSIDIGTRVGHLVKRGFMRQ